MTNLSLETFKAIDFIHKSQNAPVPYPIMLHSEQKCVQIQIYFVECVSKLKHILSIIHFAKCGAVCFQFTHFSCDDWENIYTLSYHYHQIGSMNYYPVFRVRSWNNGVRCMSFYIHLNGALWEMKEVHSGICVYCVDSFFISVMFHMVFHTSSWFVNCKPQTHCNKRAEFSAKLSYI